VISRSTPLIDETEVLLRQEFRTLAVARDHLPMLTDWGVEDFSETVHSLGMNYLTSIGRVSGRVAVSEYPVRLLPGAGPATEVPGFVRPDVVWWSRESRQVELIGEFERYEVYANKRQLLNDKIRNLLLAHRALGQGPRVLLLMLWALSGTQFQAISEFQSLIRSGFRTPGGVRVAGLEIDSRLIVGTAIFAQSEGSLRLKEILL
jgi:hypothetical protein